MRVTEAAEQLLLTSVGRVGEYVLTRELLPAHVFWKAGDRAVQPATPSGTLSEGAALPPRRVLALHAAHQTSHVAYGFGELSDPRDRAKFKRCVDWASSARHPHVLEIEECLFDEHNAAWIITPFDGDVDGVRPVSRLLREKGGQLHPGEAERAMVQLLEALVGVHPDASARAAVAVHRWHGPILMDQVLVSRHGSLSIELYGLAGLLEREFGGGAGEAGGAAHAATSSAPLGASRDEVRSIVEIGYELITGLRAETPLVPARRLVRGLDARWDEWFAQGLSAGRGFDSAEIALGRLPSNLPVPEARGWRAMVRRAMSRWEATRHRRQGLNP